MKTIVRHLIASASSLFGSSLVLGLVFAMNHFSDLPQKESPKQQSEFRVEQPKPPPKKQQQQRQVQQRQRVRASNAPAPPMPNLASAISGVDFNIPGFGTDDGLAKGSDRILGDTNKKLVMTEDAVDNPPRPRSRVQPEYPEKARQRGITGYVTLSLLINDLGEVERVKVLDASPPGMFEQNAIASIRQWQFEPASYQGEPVKAWAKQTLRYELN